MNELTRLRLHAVAIDDMGIYPAAITKGDVTTERTPWQDGWNEAVCEISTRQEAVEAWFEQLPDDAQTAIDILLGADELFLRVEGESVRMLLLMNDTFDYACADAEFVPVEALSMVALMWINHKHDGLVAWAAKRRGAEPIEEWRTPEYYAARRALEAA